MTEEEIDAQIPSPRISTSDYDKFKERLGDYASLEDLNVLEVGCGAGDLAICMARDGANVTGIDIDAVPIRAARTKAEANDIDGVRFIHDDFLKYQFDQKYDCIISLEAFEHLPDPAKFLRKMSDLIADDGRILSIFGPTWLSPHGGHLWNFTPLPWAHLYFPERVVFAVRRKVFRPTDPATCYAERRGGLNQMTIGQFKRCVRESELQFEKLEINPQFRVGRFSNPVLYRINQALTNIPGVYELFSHTLLCVLRKRSR